MTQVHAVRSDLGTFQAILTHPSQHQSQHPTAINLGDRSEQRINRRATKIFKGPLVHLQLGLLQRAFHFHMAVTRSQPDGPGQNWFPDNCLPDPKLASA